MTLGYTALSAHIHTANTASSSTPTEKKMKYSALILILLCALTRPATGWCDDRVQITGEESRFGREQRQVNNDFLVDNPIGQMKGPGLRAQTLSTAPVSTGETGADRIPLMLLPGPPKRLFVGTERASGNLRPAVPIPPIDFEAYDERRLKARLQEGLERFRRASKDRDPEAKKRAIEDVRRASAQLSRFP